LYELRNLNLWEFLDFSILIERKKEIDRETETLLTSTSTPTNFAENNCYVPEMFLWLINK
jgi:hypothetical protein